MLVQTDLQSYQMLHVLCILKYDAISVISIEICYSFVKPKRKASDDLVETKQNRTKQTNLNVMGISSKNISCVSVNPTDSVLCRPCNFYCLPEKNKKTFIPTDPKMFQKIGQKKKKKIKKKKKKEKPSELQN